MTQATTPGTWRGGSGRCELSTLLLLPFLGHGRRVLLLLFLLRLTGRRRGRGGRGGRGRGRRGRRRRAAGVRWNSDRRRAVVGDVEDRVVVVVGVAHVAQDVAVVVRLTRVGVL